MRVPRRVNTVRARVPLLYRCAHLCACVRVYNYIGWIPACVCIKKKCFSCMCDPTDATSLPPGALPNLLRPHGRLGEKRVREREKRNNRKGCSKGKFDEVEMQTKKGGRREKGEGTEERS